MAPRRPAAVVGVVVLAAVMTLSACTGSADSSGGSSGPGDGGTAAGPTPYLPVPEGVVLTDQGSELGLGEPAVVAFRPRQDEVGVLKMTVRKLQRVPIDALKEWQLDKDGQASSLFYVKVTVVNVGEEDLGGRPIPLYVLDGRNALVEPNSFTTEYQPCPSAPLPDPFPSGEKTTACLVYLVPRHGTLKAASFRPTENFNPITWVGKVEQPKKPRKKGTKGTPAG
jgi:hypothetical protein